MSRTPWLLVVLVNEVDPVNVHISLPGLMTTDTTNCVSRKIFFKDDKISVVLLGTGMINKPMNEWRTCGTASLGDIFGFPKVP